ncbi:MAG: hypothetical protein E7213_11020 [Clostridium sp.]|nr:hypothetical protein [Clostridium sp.]
MVKIIDKYIAIVRSSKLKTALFSLIFAIICFIVNFENKDGLDLNYQISFCAISSAFLGLIWYACSYGMVKVSDNINERKEKEVQAQIEAKRKKADVHKKVNNKKKKKNR